MTPVLCVKVFLGGHIFKDGLWNPMTGLPKSLRIDLWSERSQNKSKTRIQSFAQLHRTLIIYYSPGCWVVLFLSISFAFCLDMCHLDFFFFFFFLFLGLYLQHMEVARLGEEMELQLPTYTTATAMLDPYPTEQARDWTLVLMHTTWVCYRWATMGTPPFGHVYQTIHNDIYKHDFLGANELHSPLMCTRQRTTAKLVRRGVDSDKWCTLDS